MVASYCREMGKGGNIYVESMELFKHTVYEKTTNKSLYPSEI